jgi:hypothetical protein
MESVRGEGDWLDRMAGRTAPVQVVGPDGRLLGVFTPVPVSGPSNGAEPTADEMAEAERASRRWFTTDEVLTHLRGLG